MTTPLPPSCATHYACGKLLAEGGFGSVYRATQPSLEREVAVKVLRTQLCRDPVQRKRFLHEARIAATLSTPYIVQVLDHGVDGDIPWVVFELVEGPSLKELMDRGPVGVTVAVTAALHVARALEVAHAGGILHRDVKPENILQARTDAYKLTDFGIARWNDSDAVKTEHGVVIGTPIYLSPEQILGHPATEQSDLYALGVTLFELLAGEPPFPGPSASAVMDQHLRARAPDLRTLVADLDPRLCKLVEQALEKDLGIRIQTASDFVAQLEALAQRPIVGRTESVKPSTRAIQRTLVAAPREAIGFFRMFLIVAIPLFCLTLVGTMGRTRRFLGLSNTNHLDARKLIKQQQDRDLYFLRFGPSLSAVNSRTAIEQEASKQRQLVSNLRIVLDDQIGNTARKPELALLQMETSYLMALCRLHQMAKALGLEVKSTIGRDDLEGNARHLGEDTAAVVARLSTAGTDLTPDDLRAISGAADTLLQARSLCADPLAVEHFHGLIGGQLRGTKEIGGLVRLLWAGSEIQDCFKDEAVMKEGLAVLAQYQRRHPETLEYAVQYSRFKARQLTAKVAIGLVLTERFLAQLRRPDFDARPEAEWNAIVLEEARLQRALQALLAPDPLASTVEWKSAAAVGASGLLTSLARSYTLQVTRRRTVPVAPSKADVRAAFGGYARAIGAYLESRSSSDDFRDCGPVLQSLVTTGDWLIVATPRGESATDPFGGITLFQQELGRVRPSAQLPYTTALRLCLAKVDTVNKRSDDVIRMGTLLHEQLVKGSPDYDSLFEVMINLVLRCAAALREWGHGPEQLKNDVARLWPGGNSQNWGTVRRDIEQRRRLLSAALGWISGERPEVWRSQAHMARAVLQGLRLADVVRTRAIATSANPAAPPPPMGDTEHLQLNAFFRDMLAFLEIWPAHATSQSYLYATTLYELKAVAACLNGPMVDPRFSAAYKPQVTEFTSRLKQRAKGAHALAHEAALKAWESGTRGEGDHTLRKELDELDKRFGLRPAVGGSR